MPLRPRRAALACALMLLATPSAALATDPGAPAPPTTLETTQQAQGLAVVLGWPAAPGAATYRVFRSAAPLAAPDDAALLGATAERRFVDTAAPQGHAWHYAVQAVDAAGRGSDLRAAGPTTVQDGTAPLRAAAAGWLAGGQAPAEGFAPSFARAYDDAYSGRVAGTVDDVEDLDGARVPAPWVGFAQTYSSAYTGPVRGTWSSVPDPSSFEVRVYSVTDDAYLQGAYPLRADGTWTSGKQAVRAGEKLAVVMSRDGARELTRSGRPKTAIAGVAVRITTRSDAEYAQDEVPLFSDGTFRSQVAVRAGTKVARLVKTSTDRTLASTAWPAPAAPTGLVRSFAVPQEDPAYGSGTDTPGGRIEQRSWIYDDAIAAIAFAYAGDRPRARATLERVAALQRANGSLEFSFDAVTAAAVSPYERTGTLAWAGYAALEYERLTGDASFRGLATGVADRLLGLQVTTANGFDAADPRLGSVLGGSGRHDATGAFAPEPVSWASTEHNVDAYFLLRDLRRVTGEARYGDAARRVRHSLLEHHWQPTLSRFAQGVGPGGPDVSRALDLASWGGLFLLAVGERDKAAGAAAELAAFRVDGTSVRTSTGPDDFNTRYAAAGPFSGYRPYLPGGEYTAPPETVWSEGTWGALLLRLRLGEDVGADLASMRRLQQVDPGGGLLQVTAGAARDPYDFHVWPSVGGTAWATLVAADAGALWRADEPAER